jgi:hypothetical protein
MSARLVFDSQIFEYLRGQEDHYVEPSTLADRDLL